MYDLNVPWPVREYDTSATPAQLANVRNTVAMLYTLGYRHIALNFIVAEATKLPLHTPAQLNPMPMAELRAALAQYHGLHLFSRITLVVTDPAKTQSLLKLTAAGCFDLIAVQPTTEKALQIAAASLDVDLICLPMAARLPFFLKHKGVGQAVLRGVKFEVCYAGMVAGAAGAESLAALGAGARLSRKTFFGNCLQLVRAARGRGLVVLSGAAEPLHARGHVDVLAVMRELGLKTSNSKDAFFKNAEAALVSGRLRVRSNKQTVAVGARVGTGRTAVLVEQEEAPRGVLGGYKRRAEGDTPPTAGKRAKT